MPPQARISHVKFSPDGSQLAFLQTKDDAIELWIADGATGAAKAVVTGADRINATTGDPCDWLHDNVTMVCELVPAGRGAGAGRTAVPPGPNVHENYGKAAPAPTYEDLLSTAHDDALFDYYFTSQLAGDQHRDRREDADRPARRSSQHVTPSPSGQYVLVSEVKKPFSHTMPMNGFPQDVEIWTRAGELAKKIADLPSREGTPLTGVEPGPRSYQWRADQPATIVWVEALDGGDLKNKVPFRDKRASSLAAPFSAPAGRGRENRVALRRHRLHRYRHRAADRERSRHRAGRAPGSSSRARRRARCGIASRTRPTTTRARQ